MAEENQYAKQIEDCYSIDSHILFVLYEIAQCKEKQWHREGKTIEPHVQQVAISEQKSQKTV